MIQFRRGSSDQWALANPILAEGEAGYITDTKETRIGDGFTPFNSLPPLPSDAAATEALETIESGRLSEPQLSATFAVTSEAPVSPHARYGADNTGAADARLAMQTAIDAVSTAGGGRIIIDGTYRVDAPLVPRDNVELMGVGWGQSIIKPPSGWNGGTGGSVLQVGGSSGNPIENFFVRDIKFDLSQVPTAVQAKALFVTYMRNLRFENNWVYQSTATGIGADFLDQSVIRGNRVEECGRYAQGFEDARLGCSGIGIGTGIWGDEATLVEGNFVINPVRYGIFVEYQNGISSYLTTGVKILNNHIKGAHWGIGSDGVGWSHIIGNSVESSDIDGITISPGNAGATSWGDLVAHNTVRLSGRYGMLIDVSATTGATEPDTGKFMVVNNRFVGNTGVGLKIITSAQESGYQILDNRISGNGSIGLDVTGGGLIESDIVGNRVVDNTGIGMRILGASVRLRILGNRSGDTRSSGRTQTYGIQFQSAITDSQVEGNDFRNNLSGAIDRVTAPVTSFVRRNLGYGPDAVDSVTVTASPQTYNVAERPERLYFIGGTWTSIQVNGQTVHVGNLGSTTFTLDIEPNDVVTWTYTVAPTAIKRRKM
jgi:hypothetical protein